MSSIKFFYMLLLFANLPVPPIDGTSRLRETFAADPRKDKFSAMVGMYANENGEVLPMKAVALAQQSVSADEAYQTAFGHKPYLNAVLATILASSSWANCAAVQTVGGSHAVRTLLELGITLSTAGKPTLWVLNETWGQHVEIGKDANCDVNRIPYLNANRDGIDFNVMMDAIKAIAVTPGITPIIMIEGVCQNPTGLDLTLDQWRQFGELVKSKGIFLILDMAHQGFKKGILEDGAVVQLLCSLGLTFGVAIAASKYLGMYNDRLGAAFVLGLSTEVRDLVLGTMARYIRTSVSSCPVQPAAIAAMVMTDERLKTFWLKELAEHRQRISNLRNRFVDGLAHRGCPSDFIRYQIGMFANTGFSLEIVEHLRKEYAVYILESGRICLTALNDSNIERVLDCIAATLKYVQKLA